jgi:hypothetical protein
MLPAGTGDDVERSDPERDGREPRALQQWLIQSRVLLTIGTVAPTSNVPARRVPPAASSMVTAPSPTRLTF